MTFTIKFFSIFLEEKLKSMAHLYNHNVKELTASTWKKVALGVILTLIFHLGDALLGGAPRKKLQNQRFRNRKGKPKTIVA
jgi:hypothetical protein